MMSNLEGPVTLVKISLLAKDGKTVLEEKEFYSFASTAPSLFATHLKSLEKILAGKGIHPMPPTDEQTGN